MFFPIPLNLPAYPLRLSKRDGDVVVFDELRKKHLLLTPEEWVRQHWIHHLSKEKKYPYLYMQCERGHRLNSVSRRIDLIIFNKEGLKVLLAEFKSPTVKISEKTFQQVANYNIKHKIPLLLISNGIQHYYCAIDFENKSWRFIEDLPEFEQIENSRRFDNDINI